MSETTRYQLQCDHCAATFADTGRFAQACSACNAGWLRLVERPAGEPLSSAPKMECHTEGHPVVWLPFSAYELANVAEMFRAILPGRTRPHSTDDEWQHPFNVFNSGDWAGVVHDRFVDATERYAKRGGNRAADEYRALAARQAPEGTRDV